MAFQTQNSIKNEHCLERGPGRRLTEEPDQEPSGKTAAYTTLQWVATQTQPPASAWGKKYPDVLRFEAPH